MAVGILLIFAWLYITTAATVESYGSDTSTYFGLAESLRAQQAYVFNFQPHTTYPPGYPLLLAGLMALGAETFNALVRSSIPIYFVGLFGAYLLIRMRRGPATALVVVVLAATSGVAYFWVTVGLHSDVPYLTTSVLALLFVEIGRRAPSRVVRVVSVLVVAACASYLVLLRSVGVTLVAGLLLWMAFPLATRSPTARVEALARVKLWLPAAVLPMLVLFAWMTWASRQAPPAHADDYYMQSYTQQLLKKDPHQIDSPNVSVTQLPLRTLRMASVRTTNAFRVVVNAPPLSPRWYSPVLIAFLAIVLLGFARGLVREATVLDFYVLSYGGMLLLYPFDEGTRYLFPIQPFLVMYGIGGLEGLRSYGRRLAPSLGGSGRWQLGRLTPFSVVTAALLTVIVASGLHRISVLAAQNRHPAPHTFTNAATVRAAGWIMERTDEHDVLMDDQHAILHRLTGRKTLRFPLTIDPDSIMGRILTADVDYIVVLDERPYEYYNPSTMRRFDTVRSRHPLLFAPVHVFPEGTIYRVNRDSVAGSSGTGSHTGLAGGREDERLGATGGSQ